MKLTLEYTEEEKLELYRDAEYCVLKQHGFDVPRTTREDTDEGGIRWTMEVVDRR